MTVFKHFSRSSVAH